jgi:hypothetical protein
MLKDLVAISQKFCCGEEACGYVKVIHEKEKKEKELGKNGQVSEISKTMGTQMPARKKKRNQMNKIAHVFLQSCFQVLKERYVFKEQSRIRLAIINIPHTSIHMHILI